MIDSTSVVRYVNTTSPLHFARCNIHLSRNTNCPFTTISTIVEEMDKARIKSKSLSSIVTNILNRDSVAILNDPRVNYVGVLTEKKVNYWLRGTLRFAYVTRAEGNTVGETISPKFNLDPFNAYIWYPYNERVLLSTLAVKRDELKKFLRLYAQKSPKLLNYVTLLVDKRCFNQEEYIWPFEKFKLYINQIISLTLDSNIQITIVDDLQAYISNSDRVGKYLDKPLNKIMRKEMLSKINKFINITKE